MIALGYALALLIGLSLGLLGGGGSILTIPVLRFVMGYEFKLAVPMSLVVVGVTSGVGAAAHWRNGNVNLRAAAAFAPPAILGALLGAELGLRASEALQLNVFKVVMLVAAGWMYFGPGQTLRSAGGAGQSGTGARKPLAVLALIGGLVGMLTGFVGVGGGFLYVPTLVLLAGLPMAQAVGTSLALIVVSCIGGMVRYHASPGLDWGATALFTGIALIGVALGSRLVPRVSQAVLRRSFAVFLLITGALVLLLGR